MLGNVEETITIVDVEAGSAKENVRVSDHIAYASAKERELELGPDRMEIDGQEAVGDDVCPRRLGDHNLHGQQAVTCAAALLGKRATGRPSPAS